MKLSSGMFDIKLHELEKQYEQFQERLSLCRTGGKDDIRHEIIETKEEYEKNVVLLQNRVENSRSELAAELAKAQKEFGEKTEQILRKNSLNSDEATALYAEYAIDFVEQSLLHAQLAALLATELQWEDEKGEVK